MSAASCLCSPGRLPWRPCSWTPVCFAGLPGELQRRADQRVRLCADRPAELHRPRRPGVHHRQDGRTHHGERTEAQRRWHRCHGAGGGANEIRLQGQVSVWSEEFVWRRFRLKCGEKGIKKNKKKVFVVAATYRAQHPGEHFKVTLRANQQFLTSTAAENLPDVRHWHIYCHTDKWALPPHIINLIK